MNLDDDDEEDEDNDTDDDTDDSDDDDNDNDKGDDDDDVLMFPGWSTRDGELRGPVGYDVYSFGYRDLQGDVVESIYFYISYLLD